MLKFNCALALVTVCTMWMAAPTEARVMMEEEGYGGDIAYLQDSDDAEVRKYYSIYACTLSKTILYACLLHSCMNSWNRAKINANVLSILL